MASEGDSPLSREVVVVNELGMHARAAAHFVKAASKFSSEIWVIKNAKRVNGKSIMGVLTLVAPRGTALTIEARGEDARLALQELALLVENKFGEDK